MEACVTDLLDAVILLQKDQDYKEDSSILMVGFRNRGDSLCVTKETFLKGKRST